MKVKLSDVYIDLDTWEETEVPINTLEDDIVAINDSQSFGDIIDVPEKPDDVSFMEWLIECSVIPEDSRIITLEEFVEGIDKGKIIH